MKKAFVVFAVAVSAAFFVGCQQQSEEVPAVGEEAASGMEEEMAAEAEGMDDATAGEEIE